MAYRNRPRLKDIAQATGVSIMTVQRVIAAPNLVAKPTRERILKIMQETGYVPDRNAASLVQKTTGFIGLIVSSLTSMGFSAEIEGVADFCESTGRQLLLAQTNYDKSQEYTVLTTILSRRPDGLILTFNPTQKKTRKMLEVAGIPIVETFENPRKPVDMVAGFSNQKAAVQVARHFSDTGRKRPAFFGQLLARDLVRWRAFKKECMSLLGEAPLHVPIGTGKTMREENFTEAGSFFRVYDNDPELIDAVFCASDVTASAILFECHRRGISVPGQLAICGFGDLSFAEHVSPRLTTVRLPEYEMGQKAGEMILSSLTGHVGAKKVIFDTELIKRGST